MIRTEVEVLEKKHFPNDIVWGVPEDVEVEDIVGNREFALLVDCKPEDDGERYWLIYNYSKDKIEMEGIRYEDLATHFGL